MREKNVYVLRLWRNGDKEQDWRYSLEALSGGSEARRAFTTIESLFNFLQTQLGEPLSADYSDGLR